MDPFEYFKAQLKSAGKSDAEIEGAVATLKSQVEANPALLETLQTTVRRATTDFESMKGRVDASTKKIEEYNKWYETEKQGIDTYKSQYQEALDTLRQTRESLEAAHAASNGNPPNTNPNPGSGGTDVDPTKFATKEDLAAWNADLTNRMSAGLGGLVSVASDHIAQYGKPLEVDKFIGYMTEKKSTDIRSAYNEFTAEARKTKDDAAREAEIERRVAEKLRDQNSVSSVPGSNRSSPIFQPKNVDGIPDNKQAHFAGILAENWNF